MTNLAVIGTQWGDEGKGKVVDLLTNKANVVVRFQGGNNAGHTLVVGNQTYALHLVPSGILHPQKLSVIASGVVVDPDVLIEEMESLAARGVTITPENLKISERAHIILPYHKTLDQAREAGAQGVVMKIGTTGRGIGPAYEDKAARRGLRLGDLRDLNSFKDKITLALLEKNALLTGLYGLKAQDAESIIQSAQIWVKKLLPFITDTFGVIRQAADKNLNILFEGAQGVQLDLDHGTYPYVTSSNPTTGSVAVGAGLAPRDLNSVLGLVKAYTSRVGEGPFPTELLDATGDRIREVGREYGTTTGRPRRCGWLDAVVVRAAVKLCGVDSLAVTKLDVLGGLKEIKIASHYLLDGQKIDYVPASLSDLAKVQPVYETFEGFEGDITKSKKLSDLPYGARVYLDRLSELVGAPAGLVSVGPERDQTIMLRDFFPDSK
ncbi:MAG: adenylosuccinate synthase [Deltaproteobacteria bacterium]|jgi:adenylosuccinate synthase|nr:adenylosuccinate synthase [Deltaproteobacteria bacterium]